MVEQDQSGTICNGVEESWLKRINDRYDGTLFAQLVKSFGPLIVSIGLVTATVALAISVYEMRRAQVVREATLVALLVGEMKDIEPPDEYGNCKPMPYARYGYMQILERMVDLGMNLRAIDLTCANLVEQGSHSVSTRGVPPREINLSKADLVAAKFNNSHLISANFSDADLRGAFFWGSNLSSADFSNSDLSGADVTEAVLTRANLSGANLDGVVGLTQEQLDRACASVTSPPIMLPKEKETNKKLVWKGSSCEEWQELLR